MVKFFTETMQTSKSERTRMTAALRLADVLALREERELLELKAAMRKTNAPGEAAKGEQHEEEHTDTPEDADLDTTAAAIFGTILKGTPDADAA